MASNCLSPTLKRIMPTFTLKSPFFRKRSAPVPELPTLSEVPSIDRPAQPLQISNTYHVYQGGYQYYQGGNQYHRQGNHYNQQGAQGPVYNAPIRGGVNDYQDSNFFGAHQPRDERAFHPPLGLIVFDQGQPSEPRDWRPTQLMSPPLFMQPSSDFVTIKDPFGYSHRIPKPDHGDILYLARMILHSHQSLSKMHTILKRFVDTDRYEFFVEDWQPDFQFFDSRVGGLDREWSQALILNGDISGSFNLKQSEFFRASDWANEHPGTGDDATARSAQTSPDSEHSDSCPPIVLNAFIKGNLNLNYGEYSLWSGIESPWIVTTNIMLKPYLIGNAIDQKGSMISWGDEEEKRKEGEVGGLENLKKKSRRKKYQ
ncbi:hypothetical protein MD484_g4980, partial [Candolleomyces efflorescens]